MLVKLEDFKHLNGFYRRPGAREVVFKMYARNCQVCGHQIQSLSDMWVGHRTPQSHREHFEVLVEGRIDIDNLLNLQPEHRDCNIKKSNFSAQTATLFQSALDQAAREVLSVSFERSSPGPLGLELRFDLSSAVRDGPNPDWLWLSMDAADNIVQEAFKTAAADFPEAYLPGINIAQIIVRSPSTEAAMIEFDGGFLWCGNKDSAFYKYVSALWYREKTPRLSSRKPVSVPGQCRGWYIFPHGTDLKSLQTRVFSPDHRAAMNLQNFSSWIESGQCSKSGVWVCKGEYVNKWEMLYNKFHDLVYPLVPVASFHVAKGRAKLYDAPKDSDDDGNAVKECFRCLFAEDETFRKGLFEDGEYVIFNPTTVQSFIRKKKLIIKKLANAPTCQQGAFGTEGPFPF